MESSQIKLFPVGEKLASIFSDRNYLHRCLIITFWSIAIVLGALYSWAARFGMNPDGISYLDLGDAYMQGDWHMAINGYWSPFYPWLLGLAMLALKPSPYWEFPVVHLVNFIIYLCTLASFHFFLRELIRCNRERKAGLSGESGLTLPEWAWLSLGYTFFIWSSFSFVIKPLVTIVTPDLCVVAFVYLASGILLRIRRGADSWLTFILLGMVLGLAYLAKAPMFPVAFIFLGVSMFSVGNLRRAVPRVLIALVVFLMLVSPMIVALSRTKGRLTFGDSGRLNYAWSVNGVKAYIHWQGEPTGSGIPKHPTKRVFDMPAMYEFEAPIVSTYPPWYDPSYWYDGVVLDFDLRKQIKAFLSSAKTYFHIFFTLKGGLSLVAGFLILYLVICKPWLSVREIPKQWHLLIPAITGLGMYSLLHVSPRYIASFVVLLLAGMCSGVRLSNTEETRKLGWWMIIGLLAVMGIAIFALIPRLSYHLVRGDTIVLDNFHWQRGSEHEQWRVADGLNRMGIEPGDKVGFIGYSFGAFWARLARVRIVAEITDQDMLDFWQADPSVKSQVFENFGRTGAKVIVTKKTNKIPNYASMTGWQRIGNTDYYAYFLQR